MKLEIGASVEPLTSIALGELIKVTEEMKRRENTKESFLKMRKDIKDYIGLRS